jgi:hypothetical protein
VKENSEYLGIFHLFEMNVSKLIKYLFDRHVLKWPRYYGTLQKLRQVFLYSSMAPHVILQLAF